MQMQTSDLTVKQILYSYLSCVLAATLTLILHGKIRYPNLPLGLSEGQIHLLLSRTGGWNPHRTVCVGTQNLSLLQLLYNLPSPEKCEVRPHFMKLRLYFMCSTYDGTENPPALNTHFGQESCLVERQELHSPNKKKDRKRKGLTDS